MWAWLILGAFLGSALTFAATYRARYADERRHALELFQMKMHGKADYDIKIAQFRSKPCWHCGKLPRYESAEVA